MITTIEDQQKFIVPLNRDSEKLYYDQRMIVDAPVLSEPRAWSITKVNRIAANGLNNITLAQDRFDQFRDFIEVDESNNVVGMWANYYSSTVLPKEEEEKQDIYSTITYSGLKPEIKVNGSYKKFTANFFNSEGETDPEVGSWTFSVDGEDATELVSVLTTEDSSDVQPNQIKVKFVGDDTYIGKVLLVKYTASVASELEVAIVAL